jgi:hypothetical protein
VEECREAEGHYMATREEKLGHQNDGKRKIKEKNDAKSSSFL